MELEHSPEQGEKRLSLNINCVLTALKLVLEMLTVRYVCWVARLVKVLTCNSEDAVFESRPAGAPKSVPYIQDCASFVTQITPPKFPSAL
jgi:hypothetical protein